jgi:hypothetical protein
MDRYIDNLETQLYGPGLRANVTRAFADATGPEADLVRWLIAGQRTADETLAAAMHASRAATSGAADAADEKAPVVTAARRLMVGFHKHLDSHSDLDEWNGDIDLFFPAGRSGLSTYAGPLLASVDVTLQALGADPSVPDHAKFAAKLKRARKELAAHIEATGDASHGARGGLSEQSAEKHAWLREYRGNVQIVAGLLQKSGRGDELSAIVPHLAASGGRKANDATKNNTDDAPVTPKPTA